MMADNKSLVAQIEELSGIEFRAGSPRDLSSLKELGLPQTVLDFYGAYEPSGCVEGPVRLWPIAHILQENRSLSPGCYSSEHGLVVFATTYSGDAYCFDVRGGGQVEPRIMLISHEVVGESTTAADFDRLAKPVAANLREFLDQFLRGEIDEECIYR